MARLVYFERLFRHQPHYFHVSGDLLETLRKRDWQSVGKIQNQFFSRRCKDEK
ncbi:hypothetical protein HMPREF3156_00178 [Neisseria sp. HMSC06F02]|jgi:hypothetical protein|nr:hypothetical protein HMPREF3156_00178 [Neisseria sp. HMSC06F02]